MKFNGERRYNEWGYSVKTVDLAVHIAKQR
jgi:hypothetical protein